MEAAGKPALPRLDRVRRELGQVHRGSYRECTRSAPSFSPATAAWLVRDVLGITHIGHPDAGTIYRLAAEPADLAVDDLPTGVERTGSRRRGLR
ncbi:hypothetical protein ACFWMG_10890 [Streptomyces sp. NPDC127074]|uniref:hypothetical protein n=1 Tax=Streptomyces sp. NPDC127074 TaxID=3347130 RepID=UPI00364C817E